MLPSGFCVHKRAAPPPPCRPAPSCNPRSIGVGRSLRSSALAPPCETSLTEPAAETGTDASEVDSASPAPLTQDSLEAMSKAEIKELLRAHGLPLSGLKSELIRRTLVALAPEAHPAVSAERPSVHVPRGGPLPGKHRMTRPEIVAALQERGLPDLRWKKEELYHKLRELVDKESAAAPDKGSAEDAGLAALGGCRDANIRINGMRLGHLCHPDYDVRGLNLAETRDVLRAFDQSAVGTKPELVARLEPLLRSQAQAAAKLREVVALGGPAKRKGRQPDSWPEVKMPEA